MNLNIQTKGFWARPLNIAFQDVDSFAHAAWKSSFILDVASQSESPFTRWRTGFELKPIVAEELMLPNALVWEVWRTSNEPTPVDFVGILRLSQVVKGHDAKLDYFFFDGLLRDKTDLMLAWIDWAFDNHDDWPSLHRVTLELPAHAHASLRYAKKRLRFSEEGIRKEALVWRGNWQDAVVLGLINNASAA